MTRSIDAISHTPNQYVKINIDDNGETERIKVAANPRKVRVTAKWDYRPEDVLMATKTVKMSRGYGHDEVHAAIHDALTGLDVGNEVLQTIDRLERVGHWMDDQDPVMPDNLPPIGVRGDYKPLRSGQDMLLIRADKPTPYGTWTPTVRVADDLPPVDELKDDLDDHVENRVTSDMVGQAETHYREKVDGRITADITPVESLQEANRIVRRDRYGEDIESDSNDGDSDGADGDADGGEQTTLSGF